MVANDNPLIKTKFRYKLRNKAPANPTPVSEEFVPKVAIQIEDQEMAEDDDLQLTRHIFELISKSLSQE